MLVGAIHMRTPSSLLFRPMLHLLHLDEVSWIAGSRFQTLLKIRVYSAFELETIIPTN